MAGLGVVFAGLMGSLVMAVLVGAAYGTVYRRRVEAAYPPQGRIVVTRAGPLHVLESGDPAGAPVLLIHGAHSSARDLAHALAGALSGHRVIAVDRPGFGWSPPMARQDRLAGHADAILALIEAEKLTAPVVIGHSYGGAVALALALAAPQSVGALVALAPVSHAHVGPAAWYNYVGATPLIGPILNAAIAPIVGPLLAAKGVPGAFAPQAAPDGYREAAGVDLSFRPATFAANARDLARVNRELADQDRRYEALGTPLVILAGDQDPTVYTRRHSEPLSLDARDARLTILPGVGHMPHYADPGLIAEHVQALVERVRTGPGSS